MDALRSALAREGRVLTEVLLDGDEPTAEAWAALQAEPLERVGPVRITTASPLMAAASALDTIIASLPALRAEQVRAIERLTAGRRADGLRAFGGCVQMWQVIQQSVIQIVEWLSDVLADSGADLVGAGEQLADALRSIESALQADDTSALCDVIEVELHPLIDRWLTVLGVLADDVAAAQEPADDA